MFLTSRPFYGPHYKKWAARADVGDDLAEQVFFMGQQFVSHFLNQVKYRLRPYWKLIMAAETINPCAPAHLSPVVWEGVQSLCQRFGLSDRESDLVVLDLQRQRDDAEEWSLAEERVCKNNLLAWYNKRLAADLASGQKKVAYPHANKFAIIVFKIKVNPNCRSISFMKHP